MYIIKILLYFLLMSSLVTLIFDKKFVKSLIFSILFSVFILYFSQLIFKTFDIGFKFLLIINLINIPLLIKEYKMDKLKKYKSNYFSYGFYGFIIIFIMTLLFDLKRSFVHWDEFSHWGVMLKEMLRLDKFYSVDVSSLMVHKDYPPIVQLFEFLFIRLTGKYSEALSIMSVHMLEFCLLLYAADSNIPKTKISKLFKIILIIYI